MHYELIITIKNEKIFKSKIIKKTKKKNKEKK